MSANLPSDEVAEDYRASLDDLITNDRYAISNLTLIAKENIEHAEGISRVLQNHIQRAPPPRKLPALYVLDSIVKNVGTPYTVYFGRNLHQIFMLAYSQVDAPVRRKLEEMLKTWREPVPGSLSTMPVFPVMSTQPIVDALNRFRAASGPPQGRPSPHPQNAIRIAQSQPYRSTPTPPIPYQQNQHHQNQQQQQQYQQPQYQQPPSHNGYSQYPQQAYQPPTPQPMYQLPASQPPQVLIPHFQQPTPQPRPVSAGSVDMAKLHADIDDLTIDAKIDCASHPMDQSAQKKLASLQGLKEMLDSGTLSENDLVAVRDSVLQQMAKKMASHRPTPPVHPQYPAAPLPQSYPVSQPVQQPPPQSTTPSFLNSATLANLLQATAGRGQAPQASYTQTSTPPIYHATPVPPTAAENPLFASLRASGLFSNPGALTPPPNLATPLITESSPQFNSASIRIPRPTLLNSFLSARPNQCTTCGRRFTSDDAGRASKAKHLDWHFKTKSRMVEAEQRGVTRSWYVDEREWISSREVEDDQQDEKETKEVDEKGDQKGERDWVRAPTDPTLRGMPCPIDQEHFRSEWSEEVQDFVWRDAVKVGGRYFHASCYRDLVKSSAQGLKDESGRATPIGAGRVATPDSVLGKRKAERALGEEDGGGLNGYGRVKAELG